MNLCWLCLSVMRRDVWMAPGRFALIPILRRAEEAKDPKAWESWCVTSDLLFDPRALTRRLTCDPELKINKAWAGIFGSFASCFSSNTDRGWCFHFFAQSKCVFGDHLIETLRNPQPCVLNLVPDHFELTPERPQPHCDRTGSVGYLTFLFEGENACIASFLGKVVKPNNVFLVRKCPDCS